MLDTLVGIIVGLCLVLPGFIIADLAEARRAQRLARSDWELVLRALIYAVLLQSVVLLTGWTSDVINKIGLAHHNAGVSMSWEQHESAIALYVIGVILVAPTTIGMLLGWILRRAEARGSLKWFHYALGGRDARDAWDYIFLRYGSGFVLVHLKPGVESRSPFLVGKFGPTSWAAQTPANSRDVYFEEVWPSAADGTITEQFASRRGVWLDASQIDSLFFIDPPAAPRSWRERFADWCRHELGAHLPTPLRRRLAARTVEYQPTTE